MRCVRLVRPDHPPRGSKVCYKQRGTVGTAVSLYFISSGVQSTCKRGMCQFMQLRSCQLNSLAWARVGIPQLAEA
jgi:hypothetical protein